MLKYSLWFGGVSSRDLGIEMQGGLTLSCPIPRVTTYQVPGRNGDLHISDGTFENRTAVAECYVYRKDHLETAFRGIYGWAFGDGGYQRLVSDDDPEHYLMARVANGGDVAAKIRRLSPFSLEFDCMPQRFLTCGDDAIELVGAYGTATLMGSFRPLMLSTAIGEAVILSELSPIFHDGAYVELKIPRYNESGDKVGEAVFSAYTQTVTLDGVTYRYIGDCAPLIFDSQASSSLGFSLYSDGDRVWGVCFNLSAMLQTLGIDGITLNLTEAAMYQTAEVVHHIYNPTAFDAKPRYIFYGQGTVRLRVNQVEMEARSLFHNTGTVYDSETGAVYLDSGDGDGFHLDQHAIITEPLVLRPGDNEITYSCSAGSIRRVEVIPRWWEL